MDTYVDPWSDRLYEVADKVSEERRKALALTADPEMDDDVLGQVAA